MNVATYSVILACLSITSIVAAAPSFICGEPGGKRLIEIQDGDIGKVDSKWTLQVDPEGYLNDRDGKHVCYVTDDDVRTAPGGLILLTFDGSDIRKGDRGKVVLNIGDKEISPDAGSNRIYSIEGDAPSRIQLVAALYILKPELFKLTGAEEAEQKKGRAEAAAEQDKLDKMDPFQGTYMVLNSSGPVEKLGQGEITVYPKMGEAYPVKFDLTKGGGPTWTGVGVSAMFEQDKCMWVAYGTEKTVALAVYEIKGGKLSGKWYPWFNDGTPKMVGTEVLSGPEGLNGDYKIDSAAAPGTGAAYSGTVTIKPVEIVGSNGDAVPYSVTWTMGDVKLSGMGIKSGDKLFVVTGTGADALIAKYTAGNGTMNCDWYKVGSTEKGQAAAMKN